MDQTLTNESADSFDFSILGCNESTPATTPVKTRRITLNDSASSLDVSALSFHKLGAKSTFKRPKGPAPKKRVKPTYVCNTCGKGYLSSSHYNNHVLTHRVQEAASRLPDVETIMKDRSKLAKAAFGRLKLAPCGGPQGKMFHSLLNNIEATVDSDSWEDFVEGVSELLLNSVCDVRYLLPSKLVDTLIEKVESTLTFEEIQEKLLNVLSLPAHFKEDNKQSHFLSEFMFAFVKELLEYISNSIKISSTNERDELIQLDLEERETVYYIAGSIMKGFLRLACRNNRSEKWNSIMYSINRYVLTDQPVGDSTWTMSIDRGGLLFVTRECQDFFIELTKIVYRAEKKDGSIDYNQVIKEVSRGYLAVMWSKFFENSLNESISINFMNDVVKSYCQTCGRGFAKKRLNNLRKLPKASVTLRHSVASRKKT